MDFVLRDAYMSGYNMRAFDLGRLLHYRFFTQAGLTIHSRGLPTLITFIERGPTCSARSISTARCGRSTWRWKRSFPRTMQHLFPGNPLEHLDEYRQLHRIVVPGRRRAVGDELEPGAARVGGAVVGHPFAERHLEDGLRADDQFPHSAAERTTIFSEPELMEHRLRGLLPKDLREIPLRIDVARHYHRPSGRRPAGGQNFLLNPADGRCRSSTTTSFSAVCRRVRHLPRLLEDHRHDVPILQAAQFPLGRRGRYEDEYVTWGELLACPSFLNSFQISQSKYGQAGS